MLREFLATALLLYYFNPTSRVSVISHVVVSPGDEVEVVVVHQVGRVQDAQRGGGDAPAHRGSGDRRVAHRV